jgi:hypothetical protein
MRQSSSIGRHAVKHIGAVLAAILSCAVVQAGGTGETSAIPRVRSSDPLIVAAIARGVERSPIFRGMIATIDASDGVVYLEEGVCWQQGRSCLLHSLTLSGPNRLLRIRVNARKPDGCRFVASIGHELQHAIEVLSDPSVRSSAAMFYLFRRIGVTQHHSVETTAAILAGLAVGKEMCRRPVADTYTAFVPNAERPSSETRKP